MSCCEILRKYKLLLSIKSLLNNLWIFINFGLLFDGFIFAVNELKPFNSYVSILFWNEIISDWEISVYKLSKFIFGIEEFNFIKLLSSFIWMSLLLLFISIKSFLLSLLLLLFSFGSSFIGTL